MATSQATENNQKLFRRYAKVFAHTDPQSYALHAEKLSLWLSDFKAYYAAARPEVCLCFIQSHFTFLINSKRL